MTRFMQRSSRVFPSDCRPAVTDAGFLAGWVLTAPNGAVPEVGASGADGTPSNTCQFARDPIVGPHGLFDGAAAVVDVGDTSQDIRTMVIILRPLTTTESIVDLDGTASVEVAAGTVTATGWDTPTIYVNGLADDTLAALQWQHLVVTTDVPIDVDDLDIGRDGAAYFDGRIASVSVYGDAKDAAWVARDYRRFAGGGYAGADGALVSIANETAGAVGSGSTPWDIESGTWQMVEDSSGRKAISNIAVGTISCSALRLGGMSPANDAAFGMWRWRHTKPDAASITTKIIGTDTDPAANGYALVHGTDESLLLVHLGTGTVVDGGTVSADVEHLFEVIRRNTGEFEVYVDGVTVGSATDLNIVTSTHMAIDCADAVGCQVVWGDPLGVADFARFIGEYR